MPRIGVAIPTKNRADLLRETLICLKDQTAAAFEVLVLDNDSTDATPQVFAETVGDDPRFRYSKQDSGVPMLRNFLDAMEAMPADYFMWRADDDLSAPNYIERLAQALDAAPEADLAISALRRWHTETDEVKLIPMPDFPAGDAIDRTVHLLRNKRPTWIYGLWRRPALVHNLARVGDRYPYAWAWDHLLMMPSVLAGRVTIAQDTWFVQRIMGRGAYELANRERLAARQLYARICADLLADIDVPPARLPALQAALEFHLDDRVGPLKKLRRRVLKERLLATLGLRRH